MNNRKEIIESYSLILAHSFTIIEFNAEGNTLGPMVRYK